MQYVETRNFYVKMGLFWAFSENGTSAICFFKKSFEKFSLVLYSFIYYSQKMRLLLGVFELGKSKMLGSIRGSTCWFVLGQFI